MKLEIFFKYSHFPLYCIDENEESQTFKLSYRLNHMVATIRYHSSSIIPSKGPSRKKACTAHENDKQIAAWKYAQALLTNQLGLHTCIYERGTENECFVNNNAATSTSS